MKILVTGTAELVVDNSKIKEKMGCMPKHDNLEEICFSALKWEEKMQLLKQC